ncbi:hypothetical protein B0186_04000 [Canicola haemoglobinophilus]|uniref:Uncharacterized protein n=1 Tax=Canicola haemoglobinophilus TaxID=733 RepID=A0A1V4B1Z8_9PAST|nr:hypothetical protein [Canicola haemoglobinophilus]OOS01249.1 hypothetical protein B0186_04000 [Canicola haemoglobinophilus]STO54437.1 Uncharacterised protein [Canicola haemoglobinophilus]STO60089.1 Uncharacterised protein [Canicola haemoglobinophilus]STO68971.1 Uncharacterised protein [Canicola haemoglobinophilus]
MNKLMSEKLAIQFANKIIENSPTTIFNDSSFNLEDKAKQLSNFISALAKNFESNLSEFNNIPKLD